MTCSSCDGRKSIGRTAFRDEAVVNLQPAEVVGPEREGIGSGGSLRGSVSDTVPLRHT